MVIWRSGIVELETSPSRGPIDRAWKLWVDWQTFWTSYRLLRYCHAPLGCSAVFSEEERGQLQRYCFRPEIN
jgi:hypothetical protein